jgi:dihydropteroate synthase
VIFRARNFEYAFPQPALIMGILNVTPDSFSDGGRYFERDRAIEKGLQLIREGAAILDIGGESTRPKAPPVSESEELERVLPVIEALAPLAGIPISIDTQKPGVAEAALAAGASIVNDIAANRTDDALWRVVAARGAGYVVMHMQGTPETMQDRPAYEDVVGEVQRFFEDRLEKLDGVGVPRENVVLDVGIGFGKTVEHNLALLRGAKTFTRFGRPLLLGVSRKSFMGRLLAAPLEERLPAALACTCWAVQQGVKIIRTHDVAATLRAVRMWEHIESHQT